MKLLSRCQVMFRQIAVWTFFLNTTDHCNGSLEMFVNISADWKWKEYDDIDRVDEFFEVDFHFQFELWLNANTIGCAFCGMKWCGIMWCLKIGWRLEEFLEKIHPTAQKQPKVGSRSKIPFATRWVVKGAKLEDIPETKKLMNLNFTYVNFSLRITGAPGCSLSPDLKQGGVLKLNCISSSSRCKQIIFDHDPLNFCMILYFHIFPNLHFICFSANLAAVG